MNLIEAIEIRHSRRSYLRTPINSETVAKLQEFIDKYCKKEGIRIELVLNNDKAFKGLTKSYGMFSNVNNYIGLIANDKDFIAIEKLGYYGELISLHAVAMGLGTCFVGGTFKRSDCPFTLSKEEKIICVITIGNVKEEDSVKEKLIRKATHRKSKSIKEMYTSNRSVPTWFMNGMKAVQKAPSAVNRQPVIFSIIDNEIRANIKDITKEGLALDLGIAKLHFELGVGDGKWNWGNNELFTKEKGMKEN